MKVVESFFLRQILAFKVERFPIPQRFPLIKKKKKKIFSQKKLHKNIR